MMKHSKRNLFIALGLAASLVAPGMAMADNWQKPSLKHDIRQRHEGAHNHVRDQKLAHRDHRNRHEWREHHRDRYDRNADYRRHQWREHEREYYYLNRHHGYAFHPTAYRSGIFIVPAPRLVIDLR